MILSPLLTDRVPSRGSESVFPPLRVLHGQPIRCASAFLRLRAMAWHGVPAGGIICPVMDARRSQVYNALFEIKDGKPVRLCDDRAIALSELAGEIRGKNVFLVGEGRSLRKNMKSAGIDCRMAPSNLVYQSAYGVGMAALDKTPGTADDLLPVYLRLSQAERERQERMNK